MLVRFSGVSGSTATVIARGENDRPISVMGLLFLL
jgi:hypothetical protein